MPGDGVAPGAAGLTRLLSRQTQSLGAAGTFQLTFGQDFQAFLCRFVDASGDVVVPTGVRVRLSVNNPDPSANLGNNVVPVLATIGDVIDPLAWPAFWVVHKARHLFVHNVTAVAGVSLEVTGIQGGAFPRFPTAAEIAAAIAAASASPPLPVTWAAVAPVAVGAASTSILAANALRQAFQIKSTGTLPVAIRLGAAAAVYANDFILDPGDGWGEGPGGMVYRGEIRAISTAAGGEVRVVEAT